MATYKEIKGVTVQTLSEDPVVVGATWASGGALNTGATAGGSSTSGTQTEGLFFAGNRASYPTVSGKTEQYNGTSWTEVNDLSQVRWFPVGFGPYSAALCVSGVSDINAVIPTSSVESWDGTNWTEVAELNTTRHGGAGFGTNTAGLVIGGQSRPGSPPGTPVTYRDNMESWNGSAWSETTEINTARDSMAGFGRSTTGVIGDGLGSTLQDRVESWNGSAWSEVAEMNLSRSAYGGAGISNTSGVFFGGGTGSSGGGTAPGATESWDGTSFTEVADMASGRSLYGGGQGIASAALATSGPSGSTATEEFTEPPVTQAK